MSEVDVVAFRVLTIPRKDSPQVSSDLIQQITALWLKFIVSFADVVSCKLEKELQDILVFALSVCLSITSTSYGNLSL